MALRTYQSLQGRLTREPEVSRRGEKWLLSMGIAQNHTDGRTDFIEARMWFEDRRRGELVIRGVDEATRFAEMLRKGDDVILAGRLRTNAWTDSEGAEYEVEEFVVYQAAPDLTQRRMIERVTVARVTPAAPVTAEQLAATSPFPSPPAAAPTTR